ncbi:MAG TPA: TRAP transporter substrate-binding protein [Xanthobacteraceae bacterium]|nr:TRAP transporter substrate-binding protein [Xanthobacteraceae bacterium]
MRFARVPLLALAAAALATGAAHAQDKPVNLKLSYWVPPSHLLTPGYKEWAESVKKASNGTITVTLYPSSQLGSGADHYDMVKRGVADFALINPGYTPGRFPIIGVADLPFMLNNSYKAAPAVVRFYKKYAEKEMPELIVCHTLSHEPGTFISKKLIKVPADVKGLNVRTANQTIATLVTSMGGNSVQVPIMEAYETLKRGLTDAITGTWDSLTHPAFKFASVTEYTLDTKIYWSTLIHGISRKTYDGMSAAQKKVIDDHCTPEWSARIYKYWYDDQVKREDEIRKAGDKITKITKVGPEELALWRKAAEPTVNAWKESVKKIGADPDQIIEELKAELKKQDALF